MTGQRRFDRRPNWDEFYKNGQPDEVIMIHDDTPESQWDEDHAYRYDVQKTKSQNDGPRHADKRRRTDTGAFETNYAQNSSLRSNDSHQNSASSKSTSSTDRTNSSVGSYSTSATSYSTLSNATQRVDKHSTTQLASSNTGQKRKRVVHDESDEESPELEIVAQHYDAWSNYIPPTKPPLKAKEVAVKVVREVRVT